MPYIIKHHYCNFITVFKGNVKDINYTVNLMLKGYINVLSKQSKQI